MNSKNGSNDFQVVQKIRLGTLKQANVTHLGAKLFPNKEIPVEIPTLLAVCTQKLGSEVLINQEVKPLQKIFQDFKSGVLHFTGPAGSGKTTLLKEISRKVYDKEYEGLREVDIILLVKCCDLNTRKKTTPSKLLLSFLEPELERQEMTIFEDILVKTPERVLIILDGLDTFPDYFYRSNAKKPGKVTSHNETLRVYDIIIHLLRGHLFNGCRIITSARDMNLGHLTVDICVRVHLLGLENQSIYNISQKLLQDSVDAYAMIKMLDANPHLGDLCRTPMFLISVLYARISNAKFCNGHSIVDNLLFVIKRFIDSQETSLKPCGVELEKLKELAFDLQSKGSLNFSSEALKDYQLTIESIESLVFTSPNRRNRVFFFVHQFIHEVLAALHLAGMKGPSFKDKVAQCMERPWQSFSILVMCRLVCNNSTYELAREYGLLENDNFLAEKREILLKFFEGKVSGFGADNTDPEKILFTLLALNECGDSASPLISQELSAINLDFNHMGMLWICDSSALMSVASRAKKLDALSLRRSWIQHSHLQAMCAVINQTPFKIIKLDLSENMLHGVAMTEIGQMVKLCKSEELDITGCSGLVNNNPEKALSSLKNALEQYKLKVLSISYRKESLKEDEMENHMRRRTKALIYELQGGPHTKEIIPSQITCTVPIAGKWSDTSYDFVRAITQLVPNVTDKLVVHCWKFSDENKKMLINAISMASPHLQIELSEGNNLQGTIGKDRISNPGQHESNQDMINVKTSYRGILNTPSLITPKTSEMKSDKMTVMKSVSTRDIPGHNELNEDTMNLKSPYSGTWNTPTSINPKMSIIESNKMTEMKSVPAHDQPKLCLGHAGSKDEFSIIEVAHRPMTENDIIEITKGLAAQKVLHELKLRDCGLKEDHLQKLLMNVQNLDQPVKITKLSITATDCIELLIPIMCKVMAKCGTTELNIEECSGENCLAILGKSVQENKVKLLKLDLSYRNANDFEEAGDLFSNELTELNLIGCNLQTNDLQGMEIKKSKIKRFDISYNCNLDEESVQMLPAILCKNEPVSISMEGCELTIDELIGFEDCNFDIRELDLSNNCILEGEGVEEVGRIARKRSTKEISLSSCGLEEETLDHFMRGLENHQLKRLNLSQNIGIASCPEKIGELIHKSGAVEVDLSNCRLNSCQIERLAKSFDKHGVKVEVIDLGDNERRRLDSRYVDSIRQILQHVECRLNLNLPLVSKDDKKSLEKLK